MKFDSSFDSTTGVDSVAWTSSFLKIIMGTGAMAIGTFISVWKPERPPFLPWLSAFADVLLLSLLAGVLLAGFVLFIWGIVDSYNEGGNTVLHLAILLLCGMILLMLAQLAALPEKAGYLSTMVALLSGVVLAIAIETRQKSNPMNHE